MLGDEQFCEKINNQSKRYREWQSVGGGSILYINLWLEKDFDKVRIEERFEGSEEMSWVDV